MGRTKQKTSGLVIAAIACACVVLGCQIWIELSLLINGGLDSVFAPGWYPLEHLMLAPITIATIFLSSLSLHMIKKGKASGKGMAMTALVMGLISLLLVLGSFVKYGNWDRERLEPQKINYSNKARQEYYNGLVRSIEYYKLHHSEYGGGWPLSMEESNARALYKYLEPKTSTRDHEYNIAIRKNSGTGYKSQKINKENVFIEIGPGYDCNETYREDDEYFRVIGYLESSGNWLGAYCAD